MRENMESFLKQRQTKTKKNKEKYQWKKAAQSLFRPQHREIKRPIKSHLKGHVLFTK